MSDSDRVAKRVTGSDVAREAGVSKWTVNRAFTPGASIKPESRERVLAVAERLGYRPNLLARSFATQKTQQIAVLIDDFKNPAKLPFLEKLSEALQSQGMIMVLININRHHDHIDAIMDIDQRQLDAAILFGTDFRDLQLEGGERLRSHLPLFVLARNSTIASIPSVSCDATAAMTQMCEHLWERGYRRPGFLTGPRTLSTALGRRRNFLDFWESRGVNHVTVISTNTYASSAAADKIREYLTDTPSSERVDVLMCENDALAIGALGVAKGEFGLRVPEDLAIAGFDDIDQVSHPLLALTSYRQPIEEMVDEIIRMILGQSTSGSVSLVGQLKVRSST